jgi:tripartite-type tricarboxylate transporter receptor subunit TctC
MKRRGVLATLLVFQSLSGMAQQWPSRPIRLTVPFAAGGGADVLGRLLASRLEAEIPGASVVVENRPGASGLIGAEAVARAPADGHNLLLGSVGAISILPATLPRMPIDPLTDLTPIALVAGGPAFFLAHPSLGVGTLGDLVAVLRAAPGRFVFASSGTGTSAHLVFAAWTRRHGLDVTLVPYGDNAQRMTDLLQGRAHIALDVIGPWLPRVASREITVLAVSTAHRLPGLPSVPTVAEAGFPEATFSSWFGLFAPSGTSEVVLDRVESAVLSALADPGFRTRIEGLGFTADPRPRQDTGAFLVAEAAAWRERAMAAR